MGMHIALPRPPRAPSDMPALAAVDPMTLTLRALGGQRRVDAAHADVIRALIASALEGK